MYVILNLRNVAIAKSNEIEEVSNGLLMDGVIYAEPNLTYIETELDPRIQQNMIVDGVIVENPNYIVPESETDGGEIVE